MDLLKNKADTFFLFDEVFQTSASPSSNSVEQNNKIRSFGSIRKLLCSLSELSTTERGFFVPHRWEKFGRFTTTFYNNKPTFILNSVEGLKTDNTILSLSKVREKFLHDRKNNVITGRESSRTKLEMDDKSKIKKLLEIAERDTRNSGSVRISRNFADVLITLREKEEEDKKEKEVADAMTREEARLLHMILEFYHNIGQILFLQEEELVVTKPEDMIKTFMDHFINSEKIEELKHSPNNKSLVLKGLYTKDWFIKEAWKHPETDMQERENYWILLQALGFGKLLTIDVVFVSLLVAQKSEKEIEQIAKKFREYRGEIRYAIICDLPEPTEPTSKPFFEDLSWELMKNTRVELCYARNLEHRRSKCLVSALMGRSAVFSDKRSKCKLCGNMRKIVLTCPTCADQYCINCSYLIEDCKSCQRKLESLQTEPQYLLSHYQICEGPKCSHKIMVEFVGENITSIRRAVNEFKEIFGEKFGVEAQSWSSACYVCIDSLKSLFKFDPANELGIEEEKGKKCNLKGHDMTGQEILEILLKKGTLMNPTEVEKSLKWMYENDKKIPNKDLHRALELAITKEYEETLDLLIRWNAVSKENIIEFLDDQITEIAFRNDEMKEEKSNQMDPEKGKLLEEEICQKKYIQGIQLDYAKLINKSNGSMTALKKIVEIIPDGGEILKHPVVEAFLMMKWYKLFWFWFFWISLKIVFLIIFVWYGSDVLMGTESTKYNCFQATENPKNRTDGNIINKTYQTEGRDSIVSVPLYYATLSLWAFLVVIEICQMFHELRQASLQSKKRNEKHISVILLVRSMKAHFDARNVLQFLILFCLTPPLLFLNSCWINHSLFSITYPVISFELLIEFGYHPALYKYVHMFLRVMKSYFKILLIYLPIIFGFCLGFYQMFPDDAKFPSGKFEMMGKTFVMLLGEIEYMDIPIQNDLFRMFFFLMFLFSMTLSLLNLLNAVAIADTNEMIKEAEKQLLYNVLILWESPFLEPIIKYGCCFPSIRLFEDETTVIFKVFKEGEAPLQTFGTYFKEILWGIKFGIRKNQRFLENQGKKTFIVSEEIKDKARIILFKKRQEHIKKLEEVSKSTLLCDLSTHTPTSTLLCCSPAPSVCAV